MKGNFNLSDKIAEHQNIDLNWIDVEDVKEFVKLLKKEINSQEVFRVINGELSKEIKDAFREGEEIGLKNKRKQDLEIIDKLVGDKLL